MSQNTFHICTNGKIRPYPTLACSANHTLNGETDISGDFDAVDKLNNITKIFVTNSDIDNALIYVKELLFKRLDKHGRAKFNSAAEALGVLVEEYHEVVDEAKANNRERFCDEMMDVAITGIFAYISLSQEKK